MWKIILAGLILAAAMLAIPPLPSKVLTVKTSDSSFTKGSIVVGTVVPTDSQLFSDEQEVLASINTAIWSNKLCQLGMKTILTRQKLETRYQPGWVCNSTSSVLTLS